MLSKLELEDATHTPYPFTDEMTVDLTHTSGRTRKDIYPLYEQATGDLRYLADCTRQDINFLVNYLARASRNQPSRHYSVLKNLVKYLKTMQQHGLFFSIATQ